MCGKGIKIEAEIVPLFKDDGTYKVRDEGVFTATRTDEKDIIIYLGIHTHMRTLYHTHVRVPCTQAHTQNTINFI